MASSQETFGQTFVPFQTTGHAYDANVQNDFFGNEETAEIVTNDFAHILKSEEGQIEDNFVEDPAFCMPGFFAQPEYSSSCLGSVAPSQVTSQFCQNWSPYEFKNVDNNNNNNNNKEQDKHDLSLPEVSDRKRKYPENVQNSLNSMSSASWLITVPNITSFISQLSNRSSKSKSSQNSASSFLNIFKDNMPKFPKLPFPKLPLRNSQKVRATQVEKKEREETRQTSTSNCSDSSNTTFIDMNRPFDASIPLSRHSSSNSVSSDYSVSTKEFDKDFAGGKHYTDDENLVIVGLVYDQLFKNPALNKKTWKEVELCFAAFFQQNTRYELKCPRTAQALERHFKVLKDANKKENGKMFCRMFNRWQVVKVETNFVHIYS